MFTYEQMMKMDDYLNKAAVTMRNLVREALAMCKEMK
jgi:hypothetical protein